MLPILMNSVTVNNPAKTQSLASRFLNCLLDIADTRSPYTIFFYKGNKSEENVVQSFDLDDDERR